MPMPHPIRGMREPIQIELPCKSKVKKWAFENAYTLILMGVLFALTWGAMLAYGVWFYASR